MQADVLKLDPAGYRCHGLHAPDRVWTETNCAADLWIEALHALGLDPVAGLGFTLGSDFDGAQWRMFTYPEETLALLYGVGVDELNVWRPLRSHVLEELSAGNLVAFDADAWWLPDTAGLTYRCAHQKTTVLASMIDVGRGRLGYLHNTGYYELEGEDFEALLPADPRPETMPPFTLQVRLAGRHVDGPVDDDLVLRLAALHVRRRPLDDPVGRMGTRAAADLSWLRASGLDTFHRWAFGTVRQCGANAELASAFARRLDALGVSGAGESAGALDEVAVGMKAAEMALARGVRGRDLDVEAVFAPLSLRWSLGIELLAVGLSADPRLWREQPALLSR
jgi:hypothetical protein